MKIAFADFYGWDFHPQSVDLIPLGGSHSAACYLARELARQGHEASLICNTSQPGSYDGVTCLSWKGMDAAQLRSLDLDVFVVILNAGNGAELRKLLEPKTRLVLWTQHARDRPEISALRSAGERASYDGFVTVSEWQRAGLLQEFGIDPARTTILRNAIAPAFAGLFADDASILAQKAVPPVLAYTSTPFRGLDLLIEVFPRIRQAVPGTRLQVFSSMRVYQVSAQDEESANGHLYRLCRETEGVEYLGSRPQPELARALRSVTALAYPNTFPETSCIAVLEAMASGCRVVTSQMAALPETCAGFGRLIPAGQSREAYLEQFIGETVKVLREGTDQRAATEQLLRAQVAHIHKTATWPLRAGEWVEWLKGLSRRPSAEVVT